MYDPFAKYSKQGGGGGVSHASTPDPFAKYATHAAAPKPKQETFFDKVANQAKRTVNNLKKDFNGYVTAANNTALNRKVAAGHKDQVTAGDWLEGFNQVVGKPAGYIAMTPGVPAPIRAAAGVLAAPMIASDAVNTYKQSKQGAKAGGGSPTVATTNALAQTARAFTYGPIVDAGKKWISDPKGTAQEILDNPLNIYEDVFIPASIAEGGYKGAKSVGKAVADRSPTVRNAIDKVKTPIDKYLAPFKRNNEGGTPDPFAKYTNTTESRSKMRAPEPTVKESLHVQGNTDPFAKYGTDTQTGTRSISSGDIPTNKQELAQAMYNRYIEKWGYTPSQASAMVGNAGQESSFNTMVISKDGHNSYGLFQLTGPRRTAFLKFAKENHMDPNDWRAQVDFSNYELHTTEGRAWAEMNRNPNASPEDMALTVSTYYERPKKQLANNARRQRIARSVYDGKDVSTEGYDPRMADMGRIADDAVLTNVDRDANRAPANLNIFDDSKARTADMDTLANTDIAGSEKAKNVNIIDNRRTAAEYVRTPEDVNIPRNTDRGNDFETGYREILDNSEQKPIDDDWARKVYGSDLEPETKERLLSGETRPYTGDDAELLKTIKTEENRTKALRTADDWRNNLPDDNQINREALGIDDNTVNVPGNLANTARIDRPIVNNIIYNTAAEQRPIEQANQINTSRPMVYNDVNQVQARPAELAADNMPETLRTDAVSQTPAQEVNTAPQVPTQTENLIANPGSPDVVYNPVTEGNPVSRRDILDTINKAFNVKVKHGRLGSPANVAGWFNKKTKAVRTREFMNPRTVTHELGHVIDDRFGFSDNPAYDRELIGQVYKRFGDAYNHLNAAGKRGEGFAEFFRDYTGNRTRAKEAFPTFYNAFEKALDRDPELRGATNKLSALVHQWNRQAPDDRVGGRIAWTPKQEPNGGIAKRIKDFSSALYTQMIDELNPIRDLVEEVEKRTGQKMESEANPFLQAWASRGWAGKAQVLIEHGVPEEGIKSLTDIYKSIGEGREHDFGKYLVAQREMDIAKWNEKMKQAGEADKLIQRTISNEEMIFTLEKYDKDTRIVQAASDLYNYNDYLLRQLRDSGFLSADGYKAMWEKYPHYIPFFRDFSDSAATEFVGMANNGFVNLPNPIKKMKGSTRDIINPLESIIKNTVLFTRTIEKNEVGKRIARIADIDGMGDLIERVPGAASAKDSTFSVWENGQKVTYATTPDVYKAVQLYDPQTANIVVSVLSKPASWLRFGATISPEFTAGNIVRDTISATVFSHHGFIPVYDSIRGLYHYLKKDNLYWDYMKSGAAQADIMSIDRNFLYEQTHKLLGHKSIAKDVIKSPITCLRALSECSEMATRLGEFENAQKGYTGRFNRLFGSKRESVSLRDAGIEARDVTLDFGRHGTWGKQFNRATAFFNAALQGTDKLYREFRDHPAQMAFKTAALITLPSIASWYACKDDPRYQEVPQWEKDIYWFIPTKDELYKVPKPYELGVLFGSGIERALQYAYDRDRNIDGNGFSGYGESIVDTMGPSFMPTGLIPIFEWTTNYSMFQKKNIVPQSQEDLPDWMQYGNNTSYVARQMGKALNLSPRKIDTAIYDLSGGLGKHVLGLIDDATGLSQTRPAKSLSETAFAKKFVETPYKNADSVNVLRQRYDEQNKLYNEYKETGVMPEGFEPERYAVYKNTMDALKNVNRAQMAVIDSTDLSSEEKRQRLDELNMMSVRLSRKALNKEASE